MRDLSFTDRQLLENARQSCDTGQWSWLPGCKKFLCSEQVFTMFGIARNENGLLAPSEIMKLVYPGDHELVVRACDDISCGKYIDVYFKIAADDGKHRIIHYYTTQSVTVNGELIPHGCCRDVTIERTALDVLKEQLRETEWQLKIYRRAEEVTTSGTWQINLETHEAWYSENLFRMYGLRPATAVSHLNTFTPYIHPDDKTIVLHASDLAYEHRVPLHLEYRIIRPDGAIRHFRVVSNVRKGIEGETLLTGITQDITEQKEVELHLRSRHEELDICSKHFRHTEQLAQTGTWQLNLDTRSAVYSDHLYRLYGMKPVASAIATELFLQHVYNEDKEMVKHAFAKMYEDGEPPTLDYRIVRQDGKLRYFSQTAKQMITTEGERLMIGVVQDVTDRQLLSQQSRQLNGRLSLHQEMFEQAEETAGIASWRCNLETNESFYSANVYRIFGLRPQSVAAGQEFFYQYFHPDDVDKVRRIRAQIQQDGTTAEFEYRIYRTDGELRFIKARNKILIAENDQRIIIGTLQDVTEKVLLRQKMDEQLRFIKLLSNHLVDQVMVTNTSNVIIEFNRAAENIQSVKKEDVIGKNFFDAFPQSRVPTIVENFKRALRGELLHEKKTSSPLSTGYVERFFIPMKNEDGNVEGVVTIVRDVNEELQLREQLQSRLHFTERLLDASITSIIALDGDLNYTTCNDKAAEKLKMPKEKIIGRNILDLRPSFKKDPLYAEMKKCLSGETVYLAPAETPGDGYHETHLIPLKDADQKIAGLLWLVTDLSERRAAEEKIKEVQSLLVKTAEASPDAITIYNLVEQQPVYINNRLAEWIGIDVQSMINIGVEGRLLLIHPEDRGNLLALNESLKTAADDEIKTVEYRLLNKQKQYFWIHNRSKVFKRNEKGEVVEVISVLQEITSQKIAGQRLQDAERFTIAITKSTPDLITIHDLEEDRVIYANHEQYWEKLENGDKYYQMDERTRLCARVPEQYHEQTLLFLQKRKFLEDGEMLEQELPLSGGRWINIRSKAFKRNQSGKVTQVISFTTDITAKKKAEEQILNLKLAEERQAHLSASLEKLVAERTQLLEEKNVKLEQATRELENILNAIPHYVWTTLPNGMPFFHNAYFIKKAGIDLNGNPDAWLATIHPDNVEKTARLWQQSINSGSEYYNEVKIRDASGDYRWHIAKATPLRDKNGKIKLWVGTAIDVHDLHVTENKLRIGKQ